MPSPMRRVHVIPHVPVIELDIFPVPDAQSHRPRDLQIGPLMIHHPEVIGRHGSRARVRILPPARAGAEKIVHLPEGEGRQVRRDCLAAKGSRLENIVAEDRFVTQKDDRQGQNLHQRGHDHHDRVDVIRWLHHHQITGSGTTHVKLPARSLAARYSCVNPGLIVLPS